MAPLKPDAVLEGDDGLDVLPCLKRHGSIEAKSIFRRTSTPWVLPCLKRHGSIEAIVEKCPMCPTQYLTMSEKTWLH